MGLAFWRVYHERAAQAVSEGKEEEFPKSPLQALESPAVEKVADAPRPAKAATVGRSADAEKIRAAQKVREREQALAESLDQLSPETRS